MGKMCSVVCCDCHSDQGTTAVALLPRYRALVRGLVNFHKLGSVVNRGGYRMTMVCFENDSNSFFISQLVSSGFLKF